MCHRSMAAQRPACLRPLISKACLRANCRTGGGGGPRCGQVASLESTSVEWERGLPPGAITKLLTKLLTRSRHTRRGLHPLTSPEMHKVYYYKAVSAPNRQHNKPRPTRNTPTRSAPRRTSHAPTPTARTGANSIQGLLWKTPG